MKPLGKTLVRKLAIVLVLKLAVLVALWWGFVREQHISVDGASVAAQFLQSVPQAKGVPK
jgi:multidrug resistance efflux pump